MLVQPRCKVHEDSRVVVVTPLDKALRLDTPLLNRHEKRQLTFNLQLQSVPNALELVADLKQWLRGLAGAEDSEDDDVAELEHDAFPGYRGDNDTLLCSLVKMVYSCYPHYEHAEKLAACQRELSWCASADAMVRVKETHRAISSSYFGPDQCHTSFGDLVKFMLADSQRNGERSRFWFGKVGLRAIIHTYSDMSVSIGDTSKETTGVEMVGTEESKGDEPGDNTSVHEIRLHTIHFESDLKSALESFFFGRHHNLLAIRCAFGQNSFQRRTMAMHVVTEVRNKFVKHVQSNHDGTISPKHVVFVVEQRKGGVPADNNAWMPFDPNWPKAALDSLENTAAYGFSPDKLLTDSIVGVIDAPASGVASDEFVPEGPNSNLIRLCRSRVAHAISRMNWHGSNPQRLKRLVHVLDVPGAQSAVANVVRLALGDKQCGAGKWQAHVAADRELLLQMRSYRAALTTAVLQSTQEALASVMALLEANGAAVALDRASVCQVIGDEERCDEVFVKAAACWQALVEAGIPLFIARKTTCAMVQYAGAPEIAWAAAHEALRRGSVPLDLDAKPEFVLPFFLMLERWLQKHRPTIMGMHMTVPNAAAALAELLSTSEQFVAFRAAGCFHDDLWPLLYHDICLVLTTQLAKSGQVSHVPFEFVVSVLEQLVPVVNNPDAPVLERIGAAFAAFWSHESLMCLLCHIAGGYVHNKVPDGIIAAGGAHDIALVTRHICSHVLGLVAEDGALEQWATAQEWTADVLLCWTELCKCLDIVEPDSDNARDSATDTARADARNIETCDTWLHVAKFLYEFGSMVAVPAALSVHDVVEFTTVVRSLLDRNDGHADESPAPCDVLASAEFLKDIQQVIRKLTKRSHGATTDRYQWRGVLFLHLLVGRHINLDNDATLRAAAELVVSQPFLHEPRTLPGSSMRAVLKAALGEDPQACVEKLLMDTHIPPGDSRRNGLHGEDGAGELTADIGTFHDAVADEDPSACTHDDADDGERDSSIVDGPASDASCKPHDRTRFVMNSVIAILADELDRVVKRHEHIDGPLCALVATCLEELAFGFADSEAIIASHPEYAAHIIRVAANAVRSTSELPVFTKLAALAGFRGIAKVAAFEVNNYQQDSDADTSPGEEETKGGDDFHSDDVDAGSDNDSGDETEGGDASNTSHGGTSDHANHAIFFPQAVADVLDKLVCSKGALPGASERVLLIHLLKCIREPKLNVTTSTAELVVRKFRVQTTWTQQD